MMGVDLLRIAAALFLFAILGYWTWRRVSGNGDDPTLSMTKESETGSTTLLVSGWYAVVALAAIMTVALWPEIQVTPALGLIPLSIVAAHYVVEKRERA